MIALLALVAAGKAILYDTLDPDCFWHLRVAATLQQHGIGPIVDDLSFASIKTPWTPYSWLAELGMKAIWDIGGYRAAILVQAMLMGAFVVFVALAAIELSSRGTEESKPLSVIIATSFAMYLSLPYLSFRPVTFAFVLLAICTWLLLRDRRMNERSRGVWLIVPITVVITNCHFFAVLVPLWIGALLAEAFWRRDRRSIRRYETLLGTSILACLCTPMLGGALRTMASYQAADPMVAGGQSIIAELHPLWTDPVAVVLVAIFIGCAIYQQRRLRPSEWLWMLGTFVLYARMSRLSPAFVPIAAAMLAACLPNLGNRALARPIIWSAIATVLLVGIVRIAIAFPDARMPLSAWLNRHGPDTPGYPCDAAEYVAQRVARNSGRVINEFSWGGYLAWRLQDRYQILLDGRTQLYSPQFWHAAYLDGADASRILLSSARADAAVLPKSSNHFRPLLLQMGWKSVFIDDRAEVLIPPPPDSPLPDSQFGQIEP